MKNIKNYWLAIIAILGLLYCSKEKTGFVPTIKNADQEMASKYFGILPEVSKDSIVTPEKVYLGKVLFHDTRLSEKGNNSCNSCHNLDTYGVDNKQFSTGDDGGLGGRNAPTVFNASLHFAQFWDGRAKDVEEQAGGPIMNPAEMAMHTNNEVIDRLKATDHYPDLFKKAFPKDKDPMTFDNLKKAIAAFERTLLTRSKFDQYLLGDASVLTSQEIAGMKKFVEVGCITCHNGPTVGGQMYQKFGVFFPYEKFTHSAKVDNGRMDVTKNKADQFMFKVMSLRNIEKTGPYFHDGSVKDLNEAVKVMGKVQLNKDLSQQEITDIVSFLKTLTADISADAKAIPKENLDKK